MLGNGNHGRLISAGDSVALAMAISGGLQAAVPGYQGRCFEGLAWVESGYSFSRQAAAYCEVLRRSIPLLVTV